MRERERALQIIAGISIPLLFLSGFAFPVESISPTARVALSPVAQHARYSRLHQAHQMVATWSEVLATSGQSVRSRTRLRGRRVVGRLAACSFTSKGMTMLAITLPAAGDVTFQRSAYRV
jgi:hypothetical protein